MATRSFVLAMATMICAHVCGQEIDVPMDRSLKSVRIVFGIGAEEAQTWEGAYELSEGEIIATDSWRLMGDDHASVSEFKLDVRRFYPRFWNRQGRDEATLPLEPNGLVLTLSGVNAESVLSVTTDHGDFEIPAGQIGYSAAARTLEGAVEYQRVPTHRQVVRSATEDYAPTAALGPDGTLTVAYIAFTHGEAHKSRRPITEAPEDFSFLVDPVGGDQIMVTEMREGEWSAPEPVSEAGQDLYSPAVATDGEGRLWAFWAANEDDNWDIWGRARTGGEWADPVRISSGTGSDISVVAATTADGGVWLAWQSLTAGSADIAVATQTGEGFGEPTLIANSPGNEWSPAIAASADGQVAVAWDTYARGSYDVEARVWKGGDWGETVLVSATLENEARPSAAYDRQNRLWLTYEVSPEGWGKDFGPYDQSPQKTALYKSRRAGLRVLVDGALYEPEVDVNLALPMPHGGPRWPNSPPNYLVGTPRVTVGSDGRIWVSTRIRMTRFDSQTGGTWLDFVTTLDAERWRPAVSTLGTDGWLHEASTIVAAPGNGLYMISASDGRWRNAALFGPEPWKRRQRSADAPPATTRNYVAYPDWQFNKEISVADTGRVMAPDEDIALVPVAAEEAAGPSQEAQAERLSVQAMRNYRTEVGGEEVRLWRGEFHRHTEISSDGAGDGTILDMWRYGMDMADLDWIGSGDHDNGNGRELSWWLTQKTTSMFHIPERFTSMYTYERSCNYPDGHRNAVFAQRGVRPLARLRGGMGKSLDNELADDAPRPNTPDTQMFYRYLTQFDGICASHTSGTDMGTDWRDNDPKIEPIVEIYQGDRQNYERPGAPRTNTKDWSLGGWRPRGFVSRALKMGYRLGFQSSSDHISTHMSYCNVWVEEPTRQQVIDGMRKRHIYGSTDNIIADVRCGDYFMGDEFTVYEPPTISVRLVGTAPFAEVVIIKDDENVYSTKPDSETVKFEWSDNDATADTTSYYYIRGTQVGETATRKVRSLDTGERMDYETNNGEIVWVSPMWITYTAGDRGQ